MDGVYYDSKPDWYAATIPAQAIPTDLTGINTFQVTSAYSLFPPIPPPASTFQKWLQQLPLAEKRLLANHTFAECDAEQALIQYR